jgi:hypothetical protein
VESRTHVARRARRLGRALAVSVGSGFVLGWGSIYLIGLATRLGLLEHAANRIPFVGFAVGICVGFGILQSDGFKEAVRSVVAPLILGAVFWLFGVALGGALILFGVPDGIVDYVPWVGFGLGVALGLLVFAAWGYDAVGSLVQRLRSNPKDQGASSSDEHVQ